MDYNILLNNKNGKLYLIIKQLLIIYPILSYLIIFYYVIKKRIETASIIYLPFVSIIGEILKNIIRQKRPPNAVDTYFIINNKKTTSYGMPSLHSLNAFLIATMLSKTSISIIEKVIYFTLAFIVSISRYLYGMHTLIQVFVGILLGVIFGKTYTYFLKLYNSRFTKSENS